MCTNRSKEERNRCAPAGLRGDGQICTCRLIIRGMDVHQQAKGGEGQICTSRMKRRGPDMHPQAKEKRDRCAPAG
jgi:hypothetical protein